MQYLRRGSDSEGQRGSKTSREKKLNKTEAASLLPNITKAWNTSTEQGLGVKNKDIGMIGVPGDRDFSSEGRKED